METKWQEQSSISQGDTIAFTRKLSDYPATDGWSLVYALRGNGQQIQFTSTSTGSDHLVSVDAATTELWIPGEYVLEGWATLVDGTRNQIYLASFLVRPDLATADGGVDVRTHAQKMLASIEGELEKCAQNILVETDVEGTRILREKRGELLKLRQSYIQERRGEVAAERARAGKPTGRKIQTVFAITAPATVGVEFGSGNSIFNP